MAELGYVLSRGQLITDRQAAILALLALPDPPEMPRRAYRWRWRQAKYARASMVEMILMRWWATREVDRDGQTVMITSRRQQRTPQGIGTPKIVSGVGRIRLQSSR